MSEIFSVDELGQNRRLEYAEDSFCNSHIHTQSTQGNHHAEPKPNPTVGQWDTLDSVQHTSSENQQVTSPQQPPDQFIVRNTPDPFPPSNRPTVTIPFPIILLKRIISSLLILVSIVFDWIQYGFWAAKEDEPKWLNIVDSASGSADKISVECENTSKPLATVYALFTAVGTAHSVLQFINIVGETIAEYRSSRVTNNTGMDVSTYEDQDKSNLITKCQSMFLNGYQIIHGWNETVIAAVCEDIPQIILLVAFSYSCTLDWQKFIVAVIWYVLKGFKNSFRMDSCKHKYRPCCDDCCADCCGDCCVYKYILFCVCHVFIFRLCPRSEERCIECVPYNICPDFSCKRKHVCFGLIDEDPMYAKDLFKKIETFFTIGFFAVLIKIVLDKLFKVSLT